MIKKKLSVFLIILFLLTGCGNSFKPEEVTYEGTYRNNDDFSYFLYMHCIPVESANKVDCSNSDLDACLINGSDVYRYSTNGKEFYITFITTIGKSFKTFPVKEGYSKNIVGKDDYFSYTDLTKDYLIYDNYLLDKNAPEEVIHYIEKDGLKESKNIFNLDGINTIDDYLASLDVKKIKYTAEYCVSEYEDIYKAIRITYNDDSEMILYQLQDLNKPMSQNCLISRIYNGEDYFKDNNILTKQNLAIKLIKDNGMNLLDSFRTMKY